MRTTDKNKDPIIKVKGVRKNFDDVLVLNDINFAVNRGEIVVIIGPSGSGKSTLLRSLVKLEDIDRGEIFIDSDYLARDKNNETEYASLDLLRTIRLKCGMVFQDFPLFPHMNVLENVTLSPIKVLKMEKDRAFFAARELLTKVGLANYSDAYPYELSGGQKQRAAIARVLAAYPKIILFDEPTSALDPELADGVLNVIKNLVLEKDKTMIIVTHNMKFAKEVADRIIFIENGEIIEVGSPENIFCSPKSEGLKKFLSYV